jgi:hypothetical protein
MKYKRLIAFGCSFTYGSHLPGTKYGNNVTGFDSTPNNQSWPFKLGEMLDIEVVNKGVPGSSNLEILYHILNFNFEKNDVVVVMWSFPDRDVHFMSTTKRIKPFRQLGLWLSLKLSHHTAGYVVDWLRRFDPIDQIIKSWLHIHHATLYLKSLSLDYINYPAWPNTLIDNAPDFVGKVDNFYNNGFTVIDKCENDDHPGPLSHIATAKQIHHILKEKL